MSYYTYSAISRVRGAGQGYSVPWGNWFVRYSLHAGSVTNLFEQSKTENEETLVVCVVEITEAEYLSAKKRGNFE